MKRKINNKEKAKVLRPKSLNIQSPSKMKLEGDSMKEPFQIKEDYSKEETLKILNLLENNKNYILKNICTNTENDIAFIENTNLLNIYIFLFEQNEKEFLNFNLFNTVMDKLRKINEINCQIESEIFVKILKIIERICLKEIHNNCFMKKMFFNMISFLLERKEYSKGIKVLGFEIARFTCKEFVKEAFNDLFSEYTILSGFKYNKMPFRDYIMIEMFIYNIQKGTKLLKNEYRILNEYLLQLVDADDTRTTIQNICNSCVDNLTNFNTRIFLMNLLYILIKENNIFISEFIIYFKDILYYLKNNQLTSEFETYFLAELNCSDIDQYIKYLSYFLLSYLKLKDHKKINAYKALSVFTENDFTGPERNTLISLLLKCFYEESNRNRDIILDVLNNINYSKIYNILETLTDSESILLKKKTFQIMKKYLFIKEKIKDFIIMYFNFISDKNMEKYVLESFDFNIIYSENTVDSIDCKSISNEIENKKTFELRNEFINLFCKYFFCCADKTFIKHLDIDIRFFIPNNENIFQVYFLKHYSKYFIQKFSQFQNDFIDIIKYQSKNVNIINNVFSILINLNKANVLTPVSKMKIMEIGKNILKIENCIKKCGYLLNQLDFSLDLDINEDYKIMLLAALGDENVTSYLTFDDEFDYLNTYKVRGLIFYISFCPEKVKYYESHLKEILNIYNEKLKMNNISNLDEITINEVIKHIKQQIKLHNTVESIQNMYIYLISLYQTMFFEFLTSNLRLVSKKSFKLVLLCLNLGILLPQKTIPYILVHYTLNYNNSLKNIIILYHNEIINYLEVYLTKLKVYLQENLHYIQNENLLLILIWKNLKYDKHRIKFVTKCINLIEEADLLIVYFILKNIIYFSFDKKEHKLFFESIDKIISNLEMSLESNSLENIIKLHMILSFKKAQKLKKDFTLVYEQLIYQKDLSGDYDYIMDIKKKIYK